VYRFRDYKKEFLTTGETKSGEVFVIFLPWCALRPVVFSFCRNLRRAYNNLPLLLALNLPALIFILAGKL
jgi:hypothetical protein